MARHPRWGGEDFDPAGKSSWGQAGSEDELHRLMHDLKTHQIELTQQNRELRDAQHALEISRDRYARLYDRAPVGYCTLDRNGIIREINLTGAAMLGTERGRLTGTPLWSHLDSGQAYALHAHIQAVQRSAERRTLGVRLTQRHTGHALDLRLESEPARGDDGEAICLTVMLDVTEQRHLLEQLKEREQSLSQLALHDPLTGLANRALFSDHLEQAIARTQRTGERLAVLFIDLDRFKLINDSFGHPFGDEVLKDVAARLREQIRKDDTVARIGGDEFLMLLAPMDSPDPAAAVARKLIELLRRPYAGPQGEIALTVSIGISVCPDDGTAAEDLVRQADTAMYIAKQGGRNTFRFYAADMTAQAFDRIHLRSALALAVERGELELAYQPQLALDTRRIAGIEALIRWNHPVLGCLAPDGFLALAEETGLIRGIDAWVLRTACTQRKRWQAEGLDEGTVIKINLSRRELERPELADDLDALLRELDLDARLVSLELTETGPVSDSASALETVRRLKGLGIELSIDHFGAVSSSLMDLKRLPIRELKIDKSLIDGLPQDSDDAAIAGAILALGKTLGMRVIAQGVETQNQADFLREAGCTIAQGFLYTQPLGPDELMRFVKTWA
ncbi:PAS domain S-box-containing protein/diguanylate cyclase (GGDEF) domain-containing protein [Thiocapsa roseopersicina]|uniref:PAS domain S-box-containing protein/diguanylate cyclase (GGDEF) domain-containing protein n=2 Tax=Thiocapsa roseopersicina TaxID=1058 RepID=A0A1H2R395_THIRO|nr:PAS domain S-box-containing protein/diguanylate cyclase (GGDEF) domain-containing protein [Thiocapsa roseopersicina]